MYGVNIGIWEGNVMFNWVEWVLNMVIMMVEEGKRVDDLMEIDGGIYMNVRCKDKYYRSYIVWFDEVKGMFKVGELVNSVWNIKMGYKIKEVKYIKDVGLSGVLYKGLV